MTSAALGAPVPHCVVSATAKTDYFTGSEEGTDSSFNGIGQTIANHGMFCSLYTDRGSHYFHTNETGGQVDKLKLTQVGRALKQLGIEGNSNYGRARTTENALHLSTGQLMTGG